MGAARGGVVTAGLDGAEPGAVLGAGRTTGAAAAGAPVDGTGVEGAALLGAGVATGAGAGAGAI
jgi:hypothetical protein